VLDPRSQIARRREVLFDRFVDVEHAAVRGIADGVRRRLEASANRIARDRRQAFRRRYQQAAVAGFVFIGLEKCRAARSERAIRVHFHGAHSEPVIRIDEWPTREPLAGGGGRAVDHHVESSPEPAGGDEALIGRDGGAGHAGVVHHREADAGHRLIGREDLCLDLRSVGRSDSRFNERLRGVYQNARRRVAGIANQASARRIRRLFVDACRVERTPVRP